MSPEFALAWSGSYRDAVASGTHLLGFGGADPTPSEGPAHLRTTGELVSLTDGTSIALTYPVVDGGTFIPHDAEGMRDGFMLLGRLCTAPEDLYADRLDGDTCSPNTPAAFLLHGDGTWEETPLPTDVQSAQFASVRHVVRNSSDIITMLGIHKGDNATEHVVLRFNEGNWHTLRRLPSGWTNSCATATHLYRLTKHDEGTPGYEVTTFSMYRYDLQDGTEDTLPVPELASELAAAVVFMGCNDAFPILTTSTMDGLQTVFALIDDDWVHIEGVLVGGDVAAARDVISHPQGMIVPVTVFERTSQQNRSHYFFIDEARKVTELPSEQMNGKIIRWAGDQTKLVLVQDLIGDDEPSSPDQPSSTTIQVIEI